MLRQLLDSTSIENFSTHVKTSVSTTFYRLQPSEMYVVLQALVGYKSGLELTAMIFEKLVCIETD